MFWPIAVAVTFSGAAVNVLGAGTVGRSLHGATAILPALAGRDPSGIVR